MALQIKLHRLGHIERNDEMEFWVDAVGNNRFSLGQLLEHFWCPLKPEGADGPSIAIRFVEN
jgi:hypothetical protein